MQRARQIRYTPIGMMCAFALGVALVASEAGMAVDFDYALIADENTPIPGGTGNFTSFGNPSLDGGNVAFQGFGTSQIAIYTDIGGLGVVADESTAIPGGTGNFAALFSPSLSEGNVAFSALGTGQSGIYVAFQKHRWEASGSGVWDTAGNWIFDVLPRTVVPTFVDPVNGAIITGPAGATTIRSLTLGSQTSGTADLQLQQTGTLNVNEVTTITARGKVSGDGVFNALGESPTWARSIWEQAASRSQAARSTTVVFCAATDRSTTT